jgi:hypothetical protein
MKKKLGVTSSPQAFLFKSVFFLLSARFLRAATKLLKFSDTEPG